MNILSVKKVSQGECRGSILTEYSVKFSITSTHTVQMFHDPADDPQWYLITAQLDDALVEQHNMSLNELRKKKPNARQTLAKEIVRKAKKRV